MIKKIGIVFICFFFLCSCFQKKAEQANNIEPSIILGFSQIGAESAWRVAHTESILQAAEDQHIQIIYDNAQQKQENQIKAIRSFIAYQVDVIIFVPIVATGWDNVLKEAKDANIPVLIIDREIKTKDSNLFAGFIGTNGYNAGKYAAEFLKQKAGKKKTRIVELYGTTGSSVAINRHSGFVDGIKDFPYEIVYSKSGDFLRSKGKERMLEVLESNIQFDVIFSHNDGMTLGALEAILENKLQRTPPLVSGKDFIFISIDAEQAAINELKKGNLNCIVECNPQMGPQVIALARNLAYGQPIPEKMYIQETVFTEFDSFENIKPRGY